MTTPLNVIPLASGRVKLICEFCGRKTGSRADRRDTPAGWSTVPYPADHVRIDGSVGSSYSCPDCDRAVPAILAAGLGPISPMRNRGAEGVERQPLCAPAVHVA